MPKYIPNAKRYKYPLPIHPLDQLPPLIPHNPVSWVYWLYRLVSSNNALPQKLHVEFSNGKHINISDPKEMQYLWENGFFGTAQLSRSEPTWKHRTMTRMGLHESSPSLENVTERRRVQRLEFKRERSKFEAVKLDLRRQGAVESEILDQERAFLKSLREKELAFEHEENSQVRDVDMELFTTDKQLVDLEVLELMPVEAIFLTFALPVLDISVGKLLSTLVGSAPSYEDIHELCLKYVSYHHYRSHGWCVRSGIKFGCHYLLYRRGPPFQHAEFGVMVLDVDASLDYTWYASAARVVGGAKKTFILCYVELQRTKEEVLDLWHRGNFKQVFESYKVGEIMYRRWVPGKNRD